MLSNLIRESSTEQSIKISGKKRGPQIKRYKHQLSQIPRNTLMSKWLHHLFLPKKAEPVILNETEALWAIQESAVLLVCARAAASFRGCFHLFYTRRQAVSAMKITVGP